MLNVRGTDIDYNPVVISYAIITAKDVFFFVDGAKVTDEVKSHLEGVTIKPYLYFMIIYFIFIRSLYFYSFLFNLFFEIERYESFFDELRTLKEGNKVH